MKAQNSKALVKIKAAIQKEFPEDEALQQVHLARKILAREARHQGLSFIDYIRLQGKGRKRLRDTA